MSLVTFSSVHVAYGPHVVFDGLDLVLYRGEHVGLVGPNGCGKTTLLKLITGQVRPEAGSIAIGRNLKIGYLPQEPQFDDARTVMEEMHAGFEEILAMQQRLHTLSAEMAHLSGSDLARAMKEYDRLHARFEIAGGYDYEVKTRTILAGVGLPQELFEVLAATLSGGQKSRLGLAKVLATETDLLLLDEPTNHLDLQATEWLEKFLQNYKGAAVVISHDRYLLDNVACKIIEVDGKRVAVWKGNYSNYVRTRETVRLAQERQYQQRKEMVARTLDFIARNKDQEGMRGTARGRKTRLRKLLKAEPDFLERPEQQRRIHFTFDQARGRGDIAVRCDRVKMAFGSTVLFEDLSFELEPGDRLGITGPNGTGKSTLIKLIMGRLMPQSGAVAVAPSATVGYLDQAGEELDPGKTVLEEAAAVRPDMLHGELRNRLGAFLFSGDDVFKKVAELSGGEKSRLVLCKLVLARPDILLLDEPTNHLDIDSKETLEAALAQYDGTLLVVSHDRFFLDRIVGRLLVMGIDENGDRCIGRWELVEGGYTDYSRLMAARIADRQARSGSAKAAPAGRQSRKRTSGRTTPPDIRKYNKLSIEQIEEAIVNGELEVEEILKRFGDESVYRNAAKIAELQKMLDSRRAEIDLLYKAYMWRTDASQATRSRGGSS